MTKLVSRINTCSTSQIIHSHAGTDLLILIKNLSFNKYTQAQQWKRI